MSNLNKVILLGRLGQNPELKNLPNGTSVCNFSLATSENWKDKAGQKQEKTEWHKIVVFSKLAEICNQYLKTGSMVFVEGKIQTRQWDDKEGNKRYSTEILASSVNFIGGNKDAQGENTQNAIIPEVVGEGNFTSNDIPF